MAKKRRERTETGSADGSKKKESDVTSKDPQQEPPPPSSSSSPPPPSSSSSPPPPTAAPDGPLTFEQLVPPLSEGVLSYVALQKFVRMTPVQAATIPLFLSKKDVAVQAVTGSGKTLAFLIPVVEFLKPPKKLKRGQEIGALILSPTRELAQQTHAVAQQLLRHCQMPEPLLLVGGGGGGGGNGSSKNHRPVTADLQNFKQFGSTVVIGTPGRVEDVLTKYSVVDCSELECLILDEADVLLNLGFSMTLQNILSKLPKMRRTGLFSATTSSSTNSSLKEWVQKSGMRNSVWIDVAVTQATGDIIPMSLSDSQENKSTSDNLQKDNKATTKKCNRMQQIATPSTLTNYYIVTKLDEKLSRLAAFLKQHKEEKIIVFFLTCACVDFYGSALQNLLDRECNIETLHGQMVQKRREKTMERFRAGEDDRDKVEAVEQVEGHSGSALFCTDVAARGLDVSNVHWVVQFDAPQDPAFFVHRVGRSARAGRHGKSLLFLTRKEEAYVDLLRRKHVPLLSLPKDEICCPPDQDDESDDDKAAGDDTKKSFRAERKVPGDKGETEESIRIIKSASDPSITIEDVLPKVRGLALHDRDILEKGTKAFTSYIRAYKEHHCAFIFRFASLDLGMLATSFALLRLPKMPEFKEILKKEGCLPGFTPAGSAVDLMAIPFRDKAREEARQKRLAVDIAAGKSAKQLKAEQRKAEKERKEAARREKAKQKGRNPDKKRGKHAQILDEWDELAKEERLYKKFKKGKITKEEMEELMQET